MKMNSIRVALVLLLMHSACAKAKVLPEGSGIMYDARYSFTMTAPKGWSLDNSARKGHCAVFYPNGSSWDRSDVVFYVNTREKTASIQTAAEAVKDDIAEMQRNGSPQSKAEKVGKVKLKHGRVAETWQYTGDQWGNYERTAFVVEEKGISCVVMSARTEEEMDGAIPAFERLVASYDYMGTVTIKK